jgi:hypothetical protein
MKYAPEGPFTAEHSKPVLYTWLYCCISFKSTVKRHVTPYRYYASRGHLSNLPSVTQGSKLPVRPKKPKNLLVFTPKFRCCRNVELVFRAARHTQCQFERNTTVYGAHECNNGLNLEQNILVLHPVKDFCRIPSETVNTLYGRGVRVSFRHRK